MYWWQTCSVAQWSSSAGGPREGSPEAGDTIPNGDRTDPTGPSEGEERVLRAKYLDWCSAQLADHFLALSPDEIFELAERSGPQGEQAPGMATPPSPDDDSDLSSYRAVVERVTEVLAREVDLPSFEEWQALYRRNPEAVEERLLGLWRDRT